VTLDERQNYHKKQKEKSAGVKSAVRSRKFKIKKFTMMSSDDSYDECPMCKTNYNWFEYKTLCRFEDTEGRPTCRAHQVICGECGLILVEQECECIPPLPFDEMDYGEAAPAAEYPI
jgi:hypothetical protein